MLGIFNTIDTNNLFISDKAKVATIRGQQETLVYIYVNN